ncbi:hypothetical protein J7K91_02045 [bacterium]|nr:hypothetical protein [bacterium]
MSRYEKEIDLEWPVVYRVKDVSTCQVTSSPKEKIHEIWIHEWVLYNFDFFLPDVLHELCHCKLAETVDPLFSRTAFPSKYLPKIREKEEILVYLGYATKHIDLWVNELRHQYWPEVTFLDHQTFFSSVERMMKESKFSQLFTFEGVFSLAFCLAEEKRYSLKEITSITSFLKFLPDYLVFFISKISKFLESLPSLSYEKEKDLKLLESSTQKFCQLLMLPITPYIEFDEKEDLYLWKIKEIEEAF